MKPGNELDIAVMNEVMGQPMEDFHPSTALAAAQIVLEETS